MFCTATNRHCLLFDLSAIEFRLLSHITLQCNVPLIRRIHHIVQHPFNLCIFAQHPSYLYLFPVFWITMEVMAFCQFRTDIVLDPNTEIWMVSAIRSQKKMRHAALVIEGKQCKRDHLN